MRTYLVFFALLFSGIVAADGHQSDAARIIEELNLTEAASPVSEHALWQKPQHVAILIPGSMSSERDSIIAMAQSIVGESVKVSAITGSDRDALATADVFFGFCSPGILEATPNLRWLHSYAVGVDRCMLSDAIDDYDFILTNNQRLSAPDIAEHAIGLMLGLTRNLDYYVARQKQGIWDDDGQRAVNVNGKTMLVLGLGGIGTEIARRADALGMRVTATRNSSRTGPDFVDYVGLADETFDLAAKADVVVNALPLTDKTRNLVGDDFFATMKEGAYYISVGRGDTTDTDALLASLESGRLAGAGLDVTQPEPLPEGHPLWQADNLIITPHVAAYTDESFTRTLAITMENLRRYTNGEKLLSVVDFDKQY